ncbi:MerR family transcriptional regulator [uncultured Actinomyces sp.]|uniref:MerR family transcriptional regulator n=1 Tax=uncultured Actinomyces sp. TaxID=249061 RepID=UPI0025DC21A5|nr:MerR family transcriptional regulator [uncultured Actinomyces sp.]
MPRAILATSAHVDRSRTVSSVADELGVSASTLRTWERRYGLGPERREAGSRRRYQPEDVERLRAMVNHVHAGLPAAEAAKRALADVSARPASGPLNAAQLRSVALADNLPRLEAALEAAVASHGLVHTWSRFVEPTLKSLRSTPGGDPVGCPPALMLLNAFQRVCRSVHLSRPARSLVGGDRVALIADALHETPAQVIGVALAWYGCDVRLLSSENYGGVRAADRFREYVRAGVPALTVVLGHGPACADTIRELNARYGGPTIVVGADAPDVLAPHVQRVRTISACVEEALALLAPHADLQLVGRS